MPTNTPIPTVSTGNVIAASTQNDMAVLNNTVGLLSSLGVLAGGSVPAYNAPNFQIQCGTQSATTDASGHVTVTFPSAFSNGVITFVAMNGDIGAQPNMIVSTNASGSPATTTSILVVCTTPSSGAAINTQGVRFNWIAFGW